MESIELNVYSTSGNHAVVQPPGRKFPGSVIQGDSLFILNELAMSIRKRIPPNSDEELVGEVDELLGLLGGRLRHYEAVLAEHAIDLPYFRDPCEDA